MANGQEINLELDFEEKIKRMSDRELSEFNSRQIYERCQLCKVHTLQIASHEDIINRLELRGKKDLGTAGSIGGGITFAIGAIIIIILKKLGIEI